jgi:thioredoxin reductase
MDETDVAVVGGGVAGLTAALFTARAGLDTVVLDGGGSILRRNAHLENYPGYPAGINPRTYLAMLDDQVRRTGVQRREARVHAVDPSDDGFVVACESDDPDQLRATRVVAASWADTEYLGDLPAVEDRDSKSFVLADDEGRTKVDGLYAAGRLADRYHQAIVAAGDGARTGITVVHDADSEFYHDWVVPEGYFTNRGREVPMGCEEVDSKERAQRERASLDALAPYLSEARGDGPVSHPSLADED